MAGSVRGAEFCVIASPAALVALTCGFKVTLGSCARHLVTRTFAVG